VKALSFLTAVWVAPLFVYAQNTSLPSSGSGNADKGPISSLLDKFEAATCQRDTKTALALLDQGLNAKEVDEYGNSALALDARFGRFDAVQLLVVNGADIHLRNTPVP
jgi:ankyrin repeat protein